MSREKGDLQEKALARAISLTLRGGVIAAASLSLLGLALSFRSRQGPARNSAAFPPKEVLSALKHGDPAAIALLGVGVLVLTPALRVLEMALSNLFRRDWLYAALSFSVLALMSAGIFFLGR